MHKLCLSNNSFKSFDYTDAKNTNNKSRRSLGGTQDHFENFPEKGVNESIAQPHALKSNGKRYFLDQ